MAIIGLVGPFGSGCTYVAKEILGKELGYQYLSLSDILREEYQTIKGTDSEKPDRSALQDFGDIIRESKGADYLARKVSQKINILEGDFVVDSIRNPEEVNYLKGKYVDFFVIGVFAGNNLRWERVKDSYDGNQALFLKDEERDKGEKIAHGQRVTDAFLTSDAIVLNESTIVNRNEAYKTLKAKIEKYIHLFK